MTPGPLILAGGAEFDGRMAAADRVWLAASRIFRPRLGLFPTANTERPDRAAANGVRHFRRLVTQAEAVMVTNRDTTDDGHVLSRIPDLDYAYFAGGDPLYLAETLAGSRAWEALLRRWREGMGLGGSSAGAMVMAHSIFVRERWAAGLALVPGVVVLPHFNRRDADSAERARRDVCSRGLLGLGIDESTALVWTPQEGWRVAGEGQVHLLGKAGVERYQDGDAPPGVPDPAA